MNGMDLELWLIRHGETEWSASGRHTGKTDIPLTESGRRQAAALAERLAGRSFRLVLSSPLSRAFETCRLAGFGGVAELTEDLREWDYGIYEGRTTPEIRRDIPKWTIWADDPPGGETIEQVAARAFRVINRATAGKGRVVLFSHAHLLRILAVCWLGLPPAAGRFLVLGAASISILGYERETPVIMTWNQDWNPRNESPVFTREEVCNSI